MKNNSGKLKIAHVISSLKIGGAESLLVDFLRNLDKEKYENHVIYFHKGPNVEKIKNLDIKCYEINGLICKYDPLFLFRFILLIFKLKPNCIHSSLWSANVISRLVGFIFKIPVVSTIHLFTNTEQKSKNTLFRYLIDRATLSLTKKLILVSSHMEPLFKKNYSWIPAHKIEVIQNGIDQDFLLNGPRVSRESLLLDNEDFIIGSVGRFIPRKNHKLLVFSFAKLTKTYKNVQLILIGQGPLENELRELVKTLGISDKVLFINTDAACKYYPLFDCFVLPSDQEGLSIALLEAMSFGVPPIIRHNSFKHEVITHRKNGIIFLDENIDTLKKSIEELILDENLKKDISNASKDMIKNNFNLSKMASDYLLIYKSLTKNH